MTLVMPQNSLEVDQVMKKSHFKIISVLVYSSSYLDLVVGRPAKHEFMAKGNLKINIYPIIFRFLLSPQNFVFSFLLSSRIFIQPHDLLGKLIESVPKNDESLERIVVLLKEWTRVRRRTNFCLPMTWWKKETFVFPKTSHLTVVSVRLSRRGNHGAS